MEERHREGHDSSTIRRRRKGRLARDPTPDAAHTRPGSASRYRDEDSSQLESTTTAEDAVGAQVVRMQIRPPGSMSAHESKILRRRDKNFASAAGRSLSQPRQADRLSSPEAQNLIQTQVKRSLSSPRHKEESDESDLMRRSAVPAHSRSHDRRSAGREPVADESLSRLDKNLRRFEEERKRFEAEKRHFEREKLRYRQIYDHEERKKILQNYRKNSDRMQLPTEPEERRRLAHSLRLQPGEAAPQVRRRQRHSGYEESSTQFSSSDTEDVAAKRLSSQLSPVRRHVSSAATHVASVRGPPPQPPARRSVSRNNSLSPIRPARRSKTPEQAKDTSRKSSIDASEKVMLVAPPPPAIETEMTENKVEEVKRRASLKMEEGPETLQENATNSIDTQKVPSEAEEKVSFLKKLFRRFAKSETKTKETKETRETLQTDDEKKEESDQAEEAVKIASFAFLKMFWRDSRCQWKILKKDYAHEAREISRLRNKCVAHLILLTMLCGFGGLMFRYTEGTSENIYKCEVRKVKRDFIDGLWSQSHSMREDDWKSLARQKLRKFEEELHTLQELGVRRHPSMKSWNFVNCILYCWTVITTIGYGHITPQTVLGRWLTIIYAIIGIPMFLILLADFGKLFTRCLKFVWAFVRRVYYTGTCRKIRKQQQVRDAMNGFNTVYDMAIRRPSHFFGMGPEADIESQSSEQGKSMSASHPDTPTSPYPETYEVDDEFNLPVSVASVLLVSYICFGAFVFTLWEDWTSFESFYFVFISMSTIGFGDFVPNHPIFMMCSIIYLVFGLALTSMFINVVQIKLSDTFKDASAKISATIGFASEMGDENGSQLKTPSELASVHGSRLGKIAEDESEGHAASPPPQLQSILRPPRPITPMVYNGSAAGPSSEVASVNAPPPLLPRRQVSMEQQPDEKEKKKKRRFFK